MEWYWVGLIGVGIGFLIGWILRSLIRREQVYAQLKSDETYDPHMAEDAIRKIETRRDQLRQQGKM